MIARRFADTNVPWYAISGRSEDRAKAHIARGILESDDLCTSVQVLQEFYAQATHPARKDRIPHEAAVRFVQTLCEFPIQDITLELFQAALQTKHRFGIAYWDAAVIEAARIMGCRTVLSEDLSHEQDYGGVRVLNPFRQ